MQKEKQIWSPWNVIIHYVRKFKNEVLSHENPISINVESN